MRVGPWDVGGVRAGAVVVPDSGGPCGRRLVACEVPEFAPFRLESDAAKYVTDGRCPGPACRVDVTGRTVVRRPYGDDAVRVRITWVGDGEPDTHCGGWLLVPDKAWVGE
jgi:hypothetical protein